MAAFIDKYSYLPQTVDIGGDIYSLGAENPVNLGFKNRNQFLDTFGSKSESLLRKYMNYSVKGKNKLVFDHCHKNNKFRGYCCNSCNRSLGVLGDNVEGLITVLNYLLINEPSTIKQNDEGMLYIVKQP
jgi:hypothetical protein